MKIDLHRFEFELEEELKAILSYWITHSTDLVNGGFIGQLTESNMPVEKADKGSVLTSRILWTFAAAFNQTGNAEYLKVADRAFHYLHEHFIDHEEGGVFWSVDYTGQVKEGKKQIYALAFATYGLSEYYKCCNSVLAKESAISLYKEIERRSFDSVNGGYYEAFARDWSQLDDLRLSAKDANAAKTMNTHLHILEAYTNLYTIWPDKQLKQQLASLITIILEKIVDPKSFHLHLYFDSEWGLVPGPVSFGHDIEASWLLNEAAKVMVDAVSIEDIKTKSVKIAKAATRGLDSDGGLWYEVDEISNTLIHEKHWWPQAEAIVGFLDAFQNSADTQFLQYAWKSWCFVKDRILDTVNGEWFWGVTANGTPIPGQDKVGIWKCPYHNARACIEGVRRVRSLTINHSKTLA